MEIKHPTYGTLDQLLREIADCVKRGEFPRIGHDGALAWFVRQCTTPLDEQAIKIIEFESAQPAREPD